MLHEDEVWDETPSRERATTPCPTNEGEHLALLAELDSALAAAKRSMSRIRIDDE